MSDRHISVVIPTLRRPPLLARALDSVFAQTHPATEVIVVVDGPDPATSKLLAAISNPQLRVIHNQRSLSAAGARNAGAAAASGTWIAFLDDDDQWYPHKLERQLEFALAHRADFVTCLSRIVAQEGTYCWPTSIYDPAEPLDAYLFDRRTSFAGSAFLQTSTHFIRRGTFRRAPFRIGTPHDDWDFALRQTKELGTRLETVPEPLVVHHLNHDGNSLSGTTGWRASLAWAEEMRPLMGRRSYSGFCLNVVGPRAATEGVGVAMPFLLWHAFRHGAPSLHQILIFLAFWTIPARLRRRVRALLTSSAPRPGAGGNELQSSRAAKPC